MSIREEIAELEHEQWRAQSASLMENETISPERRSRWMKLHIPYALLTEKQKDQDREWADKSLSIIREEIEKSGLSDEAICEKAGMRIPDETEIFLQTPTAYLGITELRTVAQAQLKAILSKLEE